MRSSSALPRGAALVLLTLLLAACPPSRPSRNDGACASACAALAGPECDVSSRQSCLARCGSEHALAARALCTSEYEAFLTCLGQEAHGCHPHAAEAVAHGTALSECQRQYGAYARCAQACREHGVVRSGDQSVRVDGQSVRVQAELTTSGCGQALPPTRRGAPAGSRCEYQSVCEPASCPCPSRAEGYRVRACVDGVCAPEAKACHLGPLAQGHEVCRPVTKTAP